LLGTNRYPSKAFWVCAGSIFTNKPNRQPLLKRVLADPNRKAHPGGPKPALRRPQVKVPPFRLRPAGNPNVQIGSSGCATPGANHPGKQLEFGA